MAYLLDKFNYTSIMNKAPSDAGFLYPYLIILPLNILIYSLIGLAPFFFLIWNIKRASIYLEALLMTIYP
jgi:hypothetical protein